MLPHGTKKVTYMKFAGRLYAGKNPQVNLLFLKKPKNSKVHISYYRAEDNHI